MPENQQERFSPNAVRRYVEEMVLIGMGVLLVFLGVFSTVPLTSVTAVGIGAFLFYTAFESFRITSGKRDSSLTRVTADTIDEDEFEEEIIDQPANGETVQQPIITKRQRQEERPAINYSAKDFHEEQHVRTMNQAEPQSEFNNLLLKALQIVKEVCFAHSVTFFWVKNDTRQLVIEGKITDSGAFTTERKIPVGVDIISRIGINGTPQVINNILPETERDLLCYYTSLQDIKSFIGVPVYYAGETSSQPIGVLGVDSKAEDAYGEETFGMLSHISKLISSLLISYTEKYDLFADVKLIEAEMKLKTKLASRPALSATVNALSEELENIIAWESIAVVLYDEGQRAWAVASARVRGSDRFVSPKQLIDFENSIVGKAIRTNSVQSVNLDRNSDMIFNAQEQSSDALRSGVLLVSPFSSGGKCYGAVAVSARNPGAFTKKEVEAVKFLSATIAPEFEIAELSTILGEHIAVDELTGTMSRKYFSARLHEELSRATDREEDLSLVFVSLYNIADIQHRYDDDGKDAALIHVARHLRASVRPYDIVARFDASTFAVVLADTIANDAFLWAEKLRTAIAGSIVSIGKKSFSISVTIGISGATSKMTGDELIKNVSHVLDLAKKAGGNIVRVF